jgi:putative copper resistance protein D
MESAPGIAEVARQWLFSPAWLVLFVAVAGSYLWAFRRASASGFNHPKWRMFLFGLGLAALAVGTVSPVAHYGRQVLWVDFTGFLLITMIAPPLMLLGAPLTLAFRASAPKRRKTLRRLYRSKFAAIVTFPVATWLTFAVTTYLWQFTSLTDLAARDDLARHLQQFSLALVGLLFWLPAISADPVRWRLAYPLRALYVFVEMTHKGLFGGMFLGMNTAMHGDFARNSPTWAPDAITDQRIAILILWIGGNLVFLAALIGIVFRWVAYEQRNQRRTDLRLRLARERARRKRAALEQVFTRPV